MTRTPSSKAAWIRTALERYERPLLRYTARITGDTELAKDVVQETFLRLCQADPARVEDHLAAWLYTVARNHALNVRKKEARMYNLNEGVAESRADGGAGPGAVAQQNEMHSIVLDAMGSLPDQQQEACRLKLHEELTYREISQVMGFRETQLPPHRIVKEKRATFAQTPEDVARRPGVRTEFANLFLAGDWTDTGLPATIEGSLRSGRKAAETVLAIATTP